MLPIRFQGFHKHCPRFHQHCPLIDGFFSSVCLTITTYDFVLYPTRWFQTLPHMAHAKWMAFCAQGAWSLATFSASCLWQTHPHPHHNLKNVTHITNCRRVKPYGPPEDYEGTLIKPWCLSCPFQKIMSPWQVTTSYSFYHCFKMCDRCIIV